MLKLSMLRTYLYIPDHLGKKIKITSKEENKSKAQVVREVMELGFKTKERKSGGETLLKIAELGKKYNLKGPRDLSKNHDKYLWDHYEG